jgi:hypothetical protein
LKLGIYIRKQSPLLPTLEWLILNNFNEFQVYEDNVEDEYEELSKRKNLSLLISDAAEGHLDAVYIHELSLLSRISVKLLETLTDIQKTNLPVYHKNGCIIPSDDTISLFKNRIINHWETIKRDGERLFGRDA